VDDGSGIPDVVVVGAGPAGCGAAVQCARLGLNVKIVDRTGTPGGLVREARLLENYPGLPKNVPGAIFSEFLSDFLENNGLRPARIEVERISREEDYFTVTWSGGSMKARTLVIAVGTRPVGYSPENAEGVTIHRSILPLLEKPPPGVAVIGGGESALDYALNLSDRGSKVVLLVRGSSFRAGGLLAERVLSRPGISVLFETTLSGATPTRNGTVKIRLDSGGVAFYIDVHAVLAAVGRRPIFPETDFRVFRRPGNVETSVPGFFICGDASLGSLGQASIAAGQGVLAGTEASRFIRRGKSWK